MITKTCPICGKEFTTYPSQDRKTCSVKCGRIHRHRHSTKYSKECPICHTEFITTKKQQIYCSKSCAAYGRAARKRTKQCEYCGNIIPYKPSQAAKMRYCSRKCFGKAQSQKSQVTITCDFCGKPFKTRKCEITQGRRFCSSVCAARGIVTSKYNYNEEQKKRLAQGSNSYQATRRRADNALGNACAICGWHKAPCDMHHITSRRTGGSDKLTNLIILCPNHHRMVHTGLISPDELTEYWHKTYDHLQLDEAFLS